uniref:Small EDRK-rich factor-like N-terminal domain-containing protein n=1 Tax=Sinocyclocheilus anshuiensis TaxID=1608454 RepID=A0A671K227_9TELE
MAFKGNQRELARQKNAKKQSDTQKGKKNYGLSAAARKQNAEIMQQKQKKKTSTNSSDDPKLLLLVSLGCIGFCCLDSAVPLLEF